MWKKNLPSVSELNENRGIYGWGVLSAFFNLISCESRSGVD
jgi:hypothetical protein